MANQEVKSSMNIGSSSLILIFIVLCLATFGLLSLSSAKSDWNLAEKNAVSIRNYYDADRKGEEFVKLMDETLKQIYDEYAGGEELMAQVRSQLSEYYREDTGFLTVEVPMAYDQALHIELSVTEDKKSRYQIEAWKVINTVDYEIDDSMPVWGGQ